MKTLILAIICSAGVALTMKASQKFTSNSKSLLMINYCVASAVSFAGMRGAEIDSETVMPVVLLAVINGVIYITTFILLQTNIRVNGATISSSVTRMGVLIPVILSIFIFKEYPGALQFAGLVTGLIALLFISFPDRKSLEAEKAAVLNDGSDVQGSTGFGMRWLLVPSLIAGGMADMTSKIFEATCDNSYDSLFVGVTFGVALLIGIVVFLRSGEKLGVSDIVCGAVLGLFNQFSTIFLVRALMGLPAYVCYTAFALGVILVVNTVNLVVMHESLRRRDYFAMVLIMIAITLLNR